MAKKNGNGDVATVEPAGLPAGLDPGLLAEMEANRAHAEHFDIAQLTIPRLVVLQDLSPQVKERDAAYVKGARPGLIFNTVQKWLTPSVEFVPAKFVVRYIAWRPRPTGGLVDQNLAREDVEANFKPDGIGRWAGSMTVQRRGHEPESVRVEVIETPEWVGLARLPDGDGWSPVAVSFPSTKAKVVKEINTLIDLTKMPASDGRKFTPPAFFHRFLLDTAIESSGENEYFNFRSTHLGWCTDAEVRGEAKALKQAFERGEVAVDDASETVDG